MEAWTLKPLVKILKKDSSIRAYIHTLKELHIISYNKDYRIWNVEWQMNNSQLSLEKKKINKYLESLDPINLNEIRNST